MKKSIFILDICIFGLSITALLIAFFKNLSNVNFLIGAGLISLMGVAQTRMAVITNLSKDNPKKLSTVCIIYIYHLISYLKIFF